MEKKLEFDESGQFSIVRTNMMEDRSYSPYCGSVFPNHPNYKTCSSPRVRWDYSLDQFRCPYCGWVSEFHVDFIERYKKHHSFDKDFNSTSYEYFRFGSDNSITP